MELETKIPEMKRIPKGKAKFCEYLQNCKLRGNKLCLIGYSLHCRIRSFYNKYGLEYLGVGGMTIADVNRLEDIK